MRPVAEGVSTPRCARYETLEDRLVLSAASLADFFASNRAQVPLEQPQHGEVTTFGDSLAQGGVSAARASYGFTGQGQTVAVIDTGIAYDQYALGNGFGAGHRVVGGWDFAENDANPYDDGPAGFHGTHVAGIVGSSDARYSGVAPGADLVALRVFDDLGNSNFDWVESALKWVHEHRNDFANPITTVNLSIGATWNANNVPNWARLEEEFAQLKADGIFVSVAAGNSFASYKTPGVSYPAASPYVTPVASVGDSGLLSNFSQRNERVLAAPGERIMSTVPDWLYGGNGIHDDFMASSGTSMAAPYVAGASVLLRQAMQFAGLENVTPDTLYSTMYNTADLVFDSVTNTSYHRLNLQRAIDSVMPGDDFGSTADTASSLGTISADKTVAGHFGRLNDQDFFQFTAGQSGTMQWSAQTSDGVAPQWTTPDGRTQSGGSLSFTVVAGQTYTVGLGTNAGLGRYTLSAQLEASAPIVVPTPDLEPEPTPAPEPAPTPPASTTTDLGVVDARRLAGQNLTGDTWYRVTASHTGILTANAAFSHAGGNIDLELYNADKQLLGTSAGSGNAERLDVTATEGQTFYLRVKGTNAAVDVRLTNLVSANGSQVDIYGTAGNDTFTFVAGARPQVSVNGVAYRFTAAQTTFTFQGGEGQDAITMTGTDARETAVLRVGNAQYSGLTFHVAAGGMERVVVNSGGGGDSARLYDSAGDDRFIARPDLASLRGDGFLHAVRGFSNVMAYASGGNDTARFYDSAGFDRFVGYASYSFMSGTGFYNYAAGFDSVVASSTVGNDRAELYGTAGNDTFLRLETSARLRGDGYSNATVGFASLRAFGGDGVDQAVFRDIGSGDYFYGRTNTARLTAAGRNEQVYDFEAVTASTRAGESARRDVQAVNYLFRQFGQA